MTTIYHFFRESRGIFTVLGCFLAQVIIGYHLTWGNIVPYVLPYLYFNPATRGTTYETIDWTETVLLSTYGFFGMLFCFISRKLGEKKLILFGVTTYSISNALTYFSIQYHVALFILTYGLIVSFGDGAVYTLSISYGIKWFPEKAGLITAIVMNGYSISPAIFSQFQALYINPKNLIANITINGIKCFNEPEILSRVPNYFLINGLVLGFMSILIFFMLKPAPKSLIAKYDSNELLDLELSERVRLLPKSQLTESINDSEQKSTMKIAKQTLKNIMFVKMFCVYVLIGFFTNTILRLYKLYGLTYINDDNFLSLIGSFGFLSTSIFRLAAGFISDRLNFKLIISFNMIWIIILLISFPLGLENIPSSLETEKKLFFAVNVILQMGFYGTFFPICSSFIAKQFGSEVFAIAYSMLSVALDLGNLLFGVVNSLFQPLIELRGIYWLSGCFAVLGEIIALSIKKKY